MAAPTAAVALNSQKITGLANGTAASDAAAFGQIPVPANGYGINGNTGLTPTPAVVLSNDAGHLASSASLGVNTMTTVLTTASLAVGTWKIVASVAFSFNDASVSGIAIGAVGTATATLEGCYAAPVLAPPSVGAGFVATLTFRATVTSAGTVLIRAQCAGGSGGIAVGSGTWANYTYTNATGYTAVRIA
jgi:hypothetical protein